MGRRKLIGVITALPESVHAKRILNGIFEQCEKYGYNVAVFGTMVNVSSKNKQYLNGELNIYELLNFDMLDAVIIDMIPIIEDGVEYVKERLAAHIPENYNKVFVDEVLTVNENIALETARNLAQKEGILCGISSGTNVAAAIKLAKKLGKGKTVVTVLPDTAERYFSTPLFSE